MRLVICLLLVLFAVIALSYYKNIEYFVTVPTSNVNDIVMCATTAGTTVDALGKPAGSLYQIVSIPSTTPTTTTTTPTTTTPTTVTLGTLKYCPSKAIASTWNPNYSWDSTIQANPTTATIATIDCTKYTLTTDVTTPPKTYTNPTLSDGDIVAVVGDSDILYLYSLANTTLRKVDSLATAQLINTTADKPKILTSMPSGYNINLNAFTAIDLNGKTVTCKVNDPKKSGPSALYQYVNPTTLDYYANADAARRMSGLRFENETVATIMLNDCNKFTVAQTFGQPGQPSGPNSSYGSLNTPGAQIGTGKPIYNPMTGQSSLAQLPKSQWQPLSYNSNASISQAAISQAASPHRHHVVPQVSVSDTAYTAMDLQNKSSLLGNIQKIVHNELAASRNQPNNNPIAMGQESCNSDSTCDQQGQEYNREKCDMSKYIKKDSIPCWGCTLDY